MNNRFKFRAWNKEDKKMYAVEGVYAYEDEYTQGGEVFLQWFKTSHYFPEQVELMQCTGLKDKNGKLIYEGDIILQYGNRYKVIFSYEDVGSCGCCVPSFSGCGFVMVSVYGSRGDLDNYSELEVIGNIHTENKDE